MLFTKLIAAVVLTTGTIYAQSTTTCTPTFGGGSRCTTTPDPMEQFREQQRQMQEETQERIREQQQQFANQQRQQQANRPLCTTYSTNPLTGQVQARTAPCGY